MKLGTYITLALVGTLLSCEMRDYETGDGPYSYLHEDLVDVTVENNTITKIVTDDGEVLNIPENMTYDVSLKDTTLRWLLYYNKVDEKTPVSLINMKTISVFTPRTVAEMQEKYPDFVLKKDTLKVSSVWISKTKKYLNINVALWVGNTSSDNATQSIGIVKDSVSTYGKGRIYYTLHHDQADVPVGYFTQDLYLSALTTEQDTIDLCIGNAHYVEVSRSLLQRKE